MGGQKINFVPESKYGHFVVKTDTKKVVNLYEFHMMRNWAISSYKNVTINKICN